MNYHVDIQHASRDPIPFSDEMLRDWIIRTITPHREAAEVTLRVVDVEEITQLNLTYRKQNKETNVLAFPANIPSHVELECPFLGDIVICPAVLTKESDAQHKPLQAHWAHIVIHGTLHLLGYDHITEQDAVIMQTLEKNLLMAWGFDDPYAEGYSN